jgi:ArsR family transcriptional regulator
MTDLSDKLKVLADPTRLKILEFLHDPILSCCSREEGVCGCDLETFLGFKQPTISHHMKLLEQAGFVSAEKRGRWVFYELLSEGFKTVRDALAKYEILAEKVVV